jgi:ubiquitin-protein ligase
MFFVFAVLIALCATLASAKPDSPANSEAGKLYKTKRAEFEQRAREWTRLHAQK